MKKVLFALFVFVFGINIVSASGLGNVFYFSSTSLRNKYDNTSGLTVRYDF